MTSRKIPLMTQKGPRDISHPVRLYLERVASQDIGDYPEWDLTRSLPKLPVPDLQETLNKYLLCIKPVVSSEQYARACQLVEQFRRPGGNGELLQRHLVEYAESVDNWVYKFWLDDMYMKVRLALPINSNPGMVFPRQRFLDRNEQLRYAARFLSGILDYKVVIDNRLLPVDRTRSREPGQPLCMEQYYRLFTSYRYPGVQRDTLVTSDRHNDDEEPEHVIVAYKNQFFVLEVVSSGIRLTDDNIYCQLKRIVQMADERLARGETIDKVGILTAASRDCWANARERLVQDATNKSSLEAIEHCIFVLCLDDPTPESFNRDDSVKPVCDVTDGRGWRDDSSLGCQTIHGNGSKHNSANRWFEKTMQFIIAEDGACGLCYEHSPSEGIAVVQLIEHLLAYLEELQQRKLPRMQSICELAHPRQLQWNVTEDIRSEIDNVSTKFDRLIEDLDLFVLRFTDYGKEFPKSQNMSPDAYIQLALQLTYFKVHGRLVSTYESASIRRFRQGRVDNIRACSVEALEWCEAMTATTATLTVKEKMALLRRAVKRQTDILVQAILGKGIDNHMLGLRQVAENIGIPTPELFRDETYAISNHFTLSTSQVPTTMDAFMLYGPVVSDGYGACYNPHPHYMVICISSFKSWPGTDSAQFASTLADSLCDMKQLCIRSSSSSSSSFHNGDVTSASRDPPMKT